LSAAAKTYTHLGLVLDADDDVQKQWERLRPRVAQRALRDDTHHA